MEPLNYTGHLLLVWVVIIAIAQGLGLVFRHCKQPAVMGEVVGGILLGPSLLGVVFPEVKGFLFPPEVVTWIGWFAQLGIVLYMFLVGLEFDSSGLRHKGKSTVAISLASILFPLVCGMAFAGWADPALAGPAASRMHYMLFVGVSMSITAFPVLARILSATGLQQTPMGNLSLACAAINDAAAWCLLALVISLAQAKTANGISTLLLVLAYLAVMFLVVRPILKKTRARAGTLLLILMTVSASVTALIGIHAIFGAFLLGAIVPKENAVDGKLAHRAEGWVRVFLLPLFFAYTGLRTQFNILYSPQAWIMCAIVIALATIGKLGGTAIVARLSGLRWRAALTLGVLLHTRGLVELIVLNAGFELNLISAKLYTMLVLMALVTTLMTCPLLQSLTRKETVLVGSI